MISTLGCTDYQWKHRERLCMAEEVIRDRTGQRLGTIAQQGNRFVARNNQSQPLGYYDPKDAYTRDVQQRIVCKGNVLAALVLKAAGL